MHWKSWLKNARRRKRRAVDDQPPEASALPIASDFGMPPTKRDRVTTTSSSGVAVPDIGTGTASPTGDPTTIEDWRTPEEQIMAEDSLKYNLKDKYDYDLFKHEYDGPTPDGTPNVLGRLKSHVSYWEDMGASDFILNTIRTGYKLPFLDTPESRYLKNKISAIRERAFVSTGLKDLLESGRIIKLSSPPKVVNPLSVAERDGKKQLILDLRYVSLHLWKQRVKFNDFKVFQHFMKHVSIRFQKRVSSY